jgi:hypothetical protein
MHYELHPMNNVNYNIAENADTPKPNHDTVYIVKRNSPKLNHKAEARHKGLDQLAGDQTPHHKHQPPHDDPKQGKMIAMSVPRTGKKERMYTASLLAP